MVTRRAFLGALACLPLAPKILPAESLAVVEPGTWIDGVFYHRPLYWYEERMLKILQDQDYLNNVRSMTLACRRAAMPRFIYLPWNDRHLAPHRWRYTVRYRRGKAPVTKWRKIR